MLDASWLWALFTVIAAASQTVRNATQRELITTLGTAGAMHVRFLFGLPFAALFLVAVVIASGQALPRPPISFWPWVLAGALAQCGWTGLMLGGFLGALASQFWFLAFALATAASVRTLALVEVLFAQAISTFAFRQATTRRETLGIVLIVVGVVLLVWAY